MHYDATNLLLRGNAEGQLIVHVTPAQAGWDYLSFEAYRMSAGEALERHTAEREAALVILGGTLDVESNHGNWHNIGKRARVFDGLPYALYLPLRTSFRVRARTDAVFAVGYAPCDREFPARLITPADVTTEIRGGDNATRQINNIIPPGFPCQRLVVVEVYTPAGNWSSYPPHKHDVHRVAPDGTLLEADLEEVYFYQLDRPEGFAIQRVYTDAHSPLHQAGAPIDAVLAPSHNDLVLVPEGYHPVACPPGYTAYYLNMLAGSAQSLANVDDPRYAWVKGSYRTKDPRVPLYSVTQVVA